MPKTKLKPYFKALAQSGGALELLVYDEIGQTWDGTGVTAADVKQAIDNAGQFSSISLRINSPGGDAFEGVAIFNLLRDQKKPIAVKVDGIAASAASVIAMAGDTVSMGTGSMLMIHNAWALAVGDATALRKEAETLDAVSLSIADVYAAKTGKPAADIKSMMDAETWMSAEQAVAEGFADDEIDDVDEDENDGALALARTFKSLSRLKNVPAALTEEPVSAAAETATAEEQPNLSLYESRLKLIR
jgi:ATP-dependent protease ClpP protease subunit